MFLGLKKQEVIYINHHYRIKEDFSLICGGNVESPKYLSCSFLVCGYLRAGYSHFHNEPNILDYSLSFFVRQLEDFAPVLVQLLVGCMLS